MGAAHRGCVAGRKALEPPECPVTHPLVGPLRLAKAERVAPRPRRSCPGRPPSHQPPGTGPLLVRRGGEVLFERGEPADDIYILECGSVLCAVDFMHASVHSRAAGRALPQDVSARHSNRRARVHWAACCAASGTAAAG